MIIGLEVRREEAEILVDERVCSGPLRRDRRIEHPAKVGEKFSKQHEGHGAKDDYREAGTLFSRGWKAARTVLGT